MKMDKVAGSGNDEFYTPEYAIAPLYKYLPPPPVAIWCPFGTEDSLFVKLFRQRGYTVNIGDITKADEKVVPDFNVMFGGSPCQDFSIAGKQGGGCMDL